MTDWVADGVAASALGLSAITYWQTRPRDVSPWAISRRGHLNGWYLSNESDRTPYHVGVRSESIGITIDSTNARTQWDSGESAYLWVTQDAVRLDEMRLQGETVPAATVLVTWRARRGGRSRLRVWRAVLP